MVRKDGRHLARWLSSHPVGGHFLNKIVLFSISFCINCSFEQVLWDILDAHFSNPGLRGLGSSLARITTLHTLAVPLCTLDELQSVVVITDFLRLPTQFARYNYWLRMNK